MRVYYFQHNGKTYFCYVKSPVTAGSPIWKNPNTCCWIVPGTITEDDYAT